MKRLTFTLTCFLLWLSPLLIYPPTLAQTEPPSWTFEDSIGRVYWNTDGSQLAFFNDHSIKVLDVASGTVTTAFTFEPEDYSSSPRVIWSPDSLYLGISVSTGMVGMDYQGDYLVIVAVADGRIIWETRFYGSMYYSAFSPDSQALAHTTIRYRLGEQDWGGSVVMVDIASGESRDFVYSGASPQNLAWSPDSRQLAIHAGQDVSIYDVATDQNTANIIGIASNVDRGYGERVWGIVWSPSGSKLATLSNNIRIWDTETGQPLVSFQSTGLDIAWGENDNSVIITGGESAEVLDADTGRLLSLRQLPFDLPENSFSYWRSDAQLAVIVDENTLTLVETVQVPSPEAPIYIVNIESLPDYDTRDLGVGEVNWSPDREILFSSATTIANLSQPEQPAHELFIDGHEVDTSLYSPDGKLLAFALSDPVSHSYSLQLWDVAQNGKVFDLNGHRAPITTLLFSEDGRWLASGSSDTSVRVWDTQTGEQIAVLWGHSGFIVGLAFSPNNQLLASIGDTTMRLWDIKTGEQLAVDSGIREWIPQGHRVTRVAFSPEGTKVIYRDAAFSDDWGAFTVSWDIKEQQSKYFDRLPTCDYCQNNFDARYSPDGRYIAITNLYGGIQLVDSHSYEPISIPYSEYIAGPIPFEFDDSQSGTWVTFSPESQLLAFVDLSEGAPAPVNDIASTHFERNTIWLVDLESRQLVHILRDNSASPYRLLFSPDGEQLLSQALDGTVKLWDVATGEVLEMWSITPE